MVDLSETGGFRNNPLLLLACGTSYNAALVGKYIFEDLMKIPVRTEIASEFNYYNNILAPDLAIAITQSGETADTLKAMKRVKESGSRTIAITNVVGSSASRTASQTFYTRAGPEISVAATKSFTAQLMILYLLAITCLKSGSKQITELNKELKQLPNKVQQVIDNEIRIVECAKYLADFEDVFFIGRGINYPVALEGALKLKETSYIHAEGLAAGEMKHHTLAVLDDRTPVIAILARDSTHEPMLTNIKEIKARGTPVIAVAEESDGALDELVDQMIPVPSVDPIFSPVVNIVALHLISYYTSKNRGCPIDFPRNLAKSVTVE
jgi:glucosamine--fructose-6-phosphate aminotransferase (isomerizing)